MEFAAKHTVSECPPTTPTETASNSAVSISLFTCGDRLSTLDKFKLWAKFVTQLQSHYQLTVSEAWHILTTYCVVTKAPPLTTWSHSEYKYC